jgi:hypothetical protein
VPSAVISRKRKPHVAQDGGSNPSGENQKLIEKILSDIDEEEDDAKKKEIFEKALEILKQHPQESRRDLINSARQKSTGDTLLHKVVTLSDSDAMIQYLLDNGANAIVFNNSKKTPIDLFLGADAPEIAIRGATPQIKRLLEKSIRQEDFISIVPKDPECTAVVKSVAELILLRAQVSAITNVLKNDQSNLCQEFKDNYRNFKTNSGSYIGSSVTWEEFINSPDVVKEIEEKMFHLCELEICPIRDFFADALDFFLYASSLTNPQCSKKDNKAQQDLRSNKLIKDAAKFFDIL